MINILYHFLELLQHGLNLFGGLDVIIDILDKRGLWNSPWVHICRVRSANLLIFLKLLFFLKTSAIAHNFDAVVVAPLIFQCYY